MHSLFQLSYPFKIESLFLVHQVLIYCLLGAFIDPYCVTRRWTFSLRTYRSQKEPYQENMGDEEGFKIHIQSQQSWQFVTYLQGVCPARAEHPKSVGFPGVTTLIHLHNVSHLSCNLAQDNLS